MNKAELISALAEKTGKSQKEAKAFLEAFTETVTESLSINFHANAVIYTSL